MQKKLLLLFFAISFTTIHAQQFDWAGNMGGTANEYGRSVATDGFGNVYVTGFFQDTADFDIGPATGNLISAGGFDVFIAKLDEDGNLLWARNLGGTGNEFAYTVDVDAAGNVYAAGRFEGTVDFDPGTGSSTLTSAGGADMFVLKLDASGSFVWAKAMGGSATDQINSMKVDAAGNVYASGVFNDTADFDPGPATLDIGVQGQEDFFILKLNANGNLGWAHGFGSSANDRSYSLALDYMGNVLATGVFSNTLDFDPGSGTTNLTAGGFFDAYVLKLDTAGNFQWVNSISGSSYEFGYGITADIFGNVFTTGYFQGSPEFNSGAGSDTLTSEGSYDIFIHKTDASGNYQWARSMGGAADDRGYSIATDTAGDVYLTGYFLSAVNFDHSGGSHVLTPHGMADYYVHKTDSAGNFLWVTQMGGAQHDFGLSLALDGEANIYATGNFEGPADFDPDTSDFTLTPAGASDVFLLKLKQCNTYSSVSVTVCNSYTSPSGLYTWYTAGTYMDTIANAEGCDSIMSITLTIDSLYEVQQNASICGGDSILLGGSYQHTAGVFSDTLDYANTCDTVILTTLSVTDVDTSVNVSGHTLTANLSGASYRWLDCDNGHQPLPGETGQSFTASANGNYALEITDGGCTDTSGCVAITDVGLPETHGNLPVAVYPNPATARVTLELDHYHSDVAVSLFSINGKNLLSQKYSGAWQVEIDLEKLPGGIYFLRIETEEGLAVRKLVKE